MLRIDSISQSITNTSASHAVFKGTLGIKAPKERPMFSRQNRGAGTGDRANSGKETHFFGSEVISRMTCRYTLVPQVASPLPPLLLKHTLGIA